MFPRRHIQSQCWIVLKMLYIVMTIHMLGIFCTNLGFTMHELRSHENFPLIRIFFVIVPHWLLISCVIGISICQLVHGSTRHDFFFRCFIFSIISVIFFYFWDGRLLWWWWFFYAQLIHSICNPCWIRVGVQDFVNVNFSNIVLIGWSVCVLVH